MKIMECYEFNEFGYQQEEAATRTRSALPRPGKSYRRFGGRDIELTNVSSEYSGSRPNVNISSTDFQDKARLTRVDSKLEEGAKRMALVLGVDLSK